MSPESYPGSELSQRLLNRLVRSNNPPLWEIASWTGGRLHWVRHGHIFRRRAVSRYLAYEREPRLQIGSGRSPLPGWLNSDLVTSEVHLDLTRRLPLPGGAFSYVFGEHVIEHLPEAAGIRLFRELWRILRPGGVVRLTTPDLKKIIALYNDSNHAVAFRDYARYLAESTWPHERPCQVFNTFMRHWGHQYIYDEEDLVAKLSDAGFKKIERYEAGESPHSFLRGVEQHESRTVPWVNAAEAMCVEASRLD